jgi:hypothetical protein
LRKDVWYGGSDEIGGAKIPNSAIDPKSATSGLRDDHVSGSRATASMSTARVGTTISRNRGERATGHSSRSSSHTT